MVGTQSFHQLRLGAHTSASGGVHEALYEAASIGANVTQLFTANQRRWDAKGISDEGMALWQKAREATGIYEVMSHASYLINLAATSPVTLEKSKLAMRQEIQRCRKLGVKWLNFHPGSSIDGDEQAGLDRIIDSLRQMKQECPDDSVRLLFEMTAGQGTQLGDRFEHMNYLFQALKDELPVGICIDTCHIFAAGYDLRAQSGWSNVLDAFDRQVGLEHLQALHLNDSVKDLGSHVDRHACLGEGKIGWPTFQAIVCDPRSSRLPMFLETPMGVDVWREEIKKLRSFASKGI